MACINEEFKELAHLIENTITYLFHKVFVQLSPRLIRVTVNTIKSSIIRTERGWEYDFNNNAILPWDKKFIINNTSKSFQEIIQKTITYQIKKYTEQKNSIQNSF